MTKLKNWAVILASSALFALTGCPDEGSSPAPPPGPGTPGVCPAGQIWNGQYCINNANAGTGYGYGSGYVWVGTATASNSKLFGEFLRDYAMVCDQNRMIDELNIGYGDCSNWTRKFTIAIVLDRGEILPEGTPGKVHFEAYYQGTWNPSGTLTIQPLNGLFRNINKFTGFEMRALGYAGTYAHNDEIKVHVLGRPDDPDHNDLAVVLSFKGIEFWRGVVYRQ